MKELYIIFNNEIKTRTRRWTQFTANNCMRSILLQWSKMMLLNTKHVFQLCVFAVLTQLHTCAKYNYVFILTWFFLTNYCLWLFGSQKQLCLHANLQTLLTIRKNKNTSNYAGQDFALRSCVILKALQEVEFEILIYYFDKKRT